MSTEQLTFEMPSASAQTPRNHFDAAGKLLDVIKGKLGAMVTLPPKETVLKAAADAYDKYVAPIDIPYVPNLIEPLVDEQLKQIFLTSVGRVYDALVA